MTDTWARSGHARRSAEGTVPQADGETEWILNERTSG